MKKRHVNKILILCISSLLVTSCINVTKRKHRSGFHIEWDLVMLKNTIPNKNTNEDNSVYLNNKNNELLDFSLDDKRKKSDSITENTFLNANYGSAIENSHEFNKTVSIQNEVVEYETVYKNKDRLKRDKLSEEKDVHLFWLLGGAPLLVLAIRKKAKNLSQWAAKNKRTAQLLVGFSATLLPIVSFIHGWIAENTSSIDLKIGVFSTLGLLSIGAYFNKKTNKNFFLRKLKEFMFIIALVGLFNSVGNKLSEDFHKNEQSIYLEKSVKNDFAFSLLKKIDDTSNKLLTVLGKVFLSLLLLGISYILEVLVLVFACSLSCSGYGIAAVVLGILGTLGVISIFTYGLFYIWKKNRGKKKDLSDAEKAQNKEVAQTIAMSLLCVIIGLLVAFMIPYT